MRTKLTSDLFHSIAKVYAVTAGRLLKKEKKLEDVPKTTLSVTGTSEGIGKIVLVSLIILMTCIILALKAFIKLTN